MSLVAALLALRKP